MSKSIFQLFYRRVRRVFRKGARKEIGFRLVRVFSRIFLPDYKFKWPNTMWWKNSFINKVVGKFDGKHSNNYDRRWMALQLTRLIESVEGDTAECGVFKGCGSYIINSVTSLQAPNRTHHIFDSFEGLSDPNLEDGSHWEQGDLAIGEKVVRENLKEFTNINYYAGWIPDRFPEVADNVFAFTHIDVDLQEPTLDSFVFFYQRTSPGGIILVDDYGFDTCPGATKAMDDYLVDKPEKMISLSGGAGFIIKGLPITEFANFE